jgi:CRP-like cAMP-binding protein
MSLLTGEPRSATVIARTDCEVWEIGKEVLAEILHENKALVQQLCELLTKRRLENEGILANSADGAELEMKEQEYKEGFLARLYSFFEL